MKRHPLIIFFCVLAACLTMSGCSQEPTQFQGYVKANYTYVSSNFDGILKQLFITEGDRVKLGQPVFVLEMQPQSNQFQSAQGKLAQAAANIAQQESQVNLQNVLYIRRQHLYATKTISKEDLDVAQANYLQAVAALNAAKASYKSTLADLSQAKWQVEQKVLFAPANSFVYDTYYTVGELVPATHPVASLLDPTQIKIIFFVPEELLGKLQLKQRVKVSCDGCETALARISYISPNAEYTPPVIYSEQTRAKLVFHIEALPLSLQDAYKLHPGQPVTVDLQ